MCVLLANQNQGNILTSWAKMEFFTETLLCYIVVFRYYYLFCCKINILHLLKMLQVDPHTKLYHGDLSGTKLVIHELRCLQASSRRGRGGRNEERNPT